MREHWLVKYWPWINKAVGILSLALPSWGTVRVAARGYPLEVLLFCAAITIAIFLLCTNQVLRLGDYVMEKFADLHRAKDFANLLADRHSVGEREMTPGTAAHYWFGIDSSPGTENTKFRWIKASVDLGHVHGAPLNHVGNANRNTMVHVLELAAFFRRNDWRRIVDEWQME